ncbi:MAG: molecular chaperone TorD family protein [Candidatus Omnitrophica bacterium]|nr:molecular chaperone TorD family protein [Candidatus Omnitrophota bacterium]
MSTEFEGKSGVYFLFSRLFREAPDPSLLNKIESFFEATDLADKVEEIVVEYTSLFVAPGEYSIPPYESFYCDALTIDASTADSPYFQPLCMPTGMKGFIYGSSARAVGKIYQEGGFELDPNFHDLPDHIACELEFVGRLYEKGKREAARNFLKNHLGRWAFNFLNNLEKQDRSVFYQRVAKSLGNFLKFECASESKFVKAF